MAHGRPGAIQRIGSYADGTGAPTGGESLRLWRNGETATLCPRRWARQKRAEQSQRQARDADSERRGNKPQGPGAMEVRAKR